MNSVVVGFCQNNSFTKVGLSLLRHAESSEKVVKPKLKNVKGLFSLLNVPVPYTSLIVFCEVRGANGFSELNV